MFCEKNGNLNIQEILALSISERNLPTSGVLALETFGFEQRKNDFRNFEHRKSNESRRIQNQRIYRYDL